MARSREFDEQTAIAGAMQLFWQRGYQAASLNDLLEVTDLSRSSFYETFGTKRGLLLASLRHYAESSMAGLVEALT
ncbi:MAG: TetR/AcrR family transcriptional regulator, partial [Panacagrimonas sp.]